MAFYFPVVSSASEIYDYEQKVQIHLLRLKEDLEKLIHWEETYNREVAYTNDPEIPEHQELLDIVKKYLER